MAIPTRLYGAPRVPAPQIQDKYRGCLLGGAVGDALGAPVEFMSRSEILRMFGEQGITDYVRAYGRIGGITDDTQMTLFTAEGMLRAWVRSYKGISSAPAVLYRAYLRWLSTQGYAIPRHKDHPEGWLITNRELFALRAPGTTCVSALQRPIHHYKASNHSKGCGGVMRVAPVGMFYAECANSKYTNPQYELDLPSRPRKPQDLTSCFEVAAEAAAITHGHPTGQLTAGVFASLVALLLSGMPLRIAVDHALAMLARYPNGEETHYALKVALELAQKSPNEAAALERLGGGWIAEEALAIAVYCALGTEDFESGVRLAVNHSGDSDSTGAMTGNLLGASLGLRAIPERLIERLELRDVIASIADDLATAGDWDDYRAEDGYYWERYPGV